MKDQEFSPTPTMQFYAFVFAKHGKGKKQQELAKLTGVSTETISRWKKIKGFLGWLEQKTSEYRQPIHERLEFIALQRLNDFRYWEALAEKSGFLVMGSEGAVPEINFILTRLPDSPTKQTDD